MNKKTNISKHPIYKQAMEICYKNITKFILISVVLIVLSFIAIAYEFYQSGKNCMEQCEKEKIIDTCNDHCY